jgi:hypothetical protein
MTTHRTRLGCLRFVVCMAVLLGLAADAAAEQPVKKVLLIGIDGTRFDAIGRAKTPHLDRLMAEGIHSPACRILGERYRKNDTISGPGWSSILTGVWADKHGVHDNKFQGTNYEAYPHFFVRLKASRPEARTVSLVAWEPIHSQITAGADVSRNYERPEQKEVLDYDRYDTQATDEAVRSLTEGNPGRDVSLYLPGRCGRAHARLSPERPAVLGGHRAGRQARRQGPGGHWQP